MMDKLTKKYQSLLKSGELSPDAAQEKLVAACAQLADIVDAPKSRNPLKKIVGRKPKISHGLYIYGPVGRGKSKITELFFENLKIKNKQRFHFHAFMKMVHEELNKHRKNKKIADPVNEVAKRMDATLLLLDEFYVTDIADAMILGRLFEAMFKQGVAVVVTSNRAPDELYLGGLNRDRFLPFIELIKKQMKMVEVAGPKDYRLHKLQQADIYLHPANKTNNAKVKKLFTELTEGVKPAPRVVEAKKRKITLPMAAKTTALVDFADLCDQALAAADYLLITKVVDTVMIQNIPVLTADMKNQALRFIALIDVLYENKVKFICTAETPPNELCHPNLGLFEFDRTISRLIEMQSKDYLAA